MADIRDDLADALSDPDPVRRAQIQMLKPLPKRFYTTVGIGPVEDGGYAILLDGRTVRTPAKQPLTAPTARAAELLAAEWDAQKEVIDPATMPVTRLANTAIDGVAKDIRAVFDDGGSAGLVPTDRERKSEGEDETDEPEQCRLDDADRLVEVCGPASQPPAGEMADRGRRESGADDERCELEATEPEEHSDLRPGAARSPDAAHLVAAHLAVANRQLDPT